MNEQKNPLFLKPNKPTDLFEGKFTREQLEKLGPEAASILIMKERAYTGMVDAMLDDVFPGLTKKEKKRFIDIAVLAYQQ